MEIPDKVFARARKLKRGAVEELFAQVYPTAIRLSRGLCGREDVAEGVVRFVMIKAAKVLPGWRDATEAERWFLHHTILTARRAAEHQPAANADLLAKDENAAMTAFVRALRNLPQQQKEAILLHFGEHLNSRYLGVAMDCSANAAQTHLDAARAALRQVVGAEIDGLLVRLEAAYTRLKPVADEIPLAARRWAAKSLRPRRVRRILWMLAVVLVIVGSVWLWLKMKG